MIPFIKPIIGQEEIDAVKAVMESGMLAQASEVASFEEEFADYCEVKHAIAVNSGTAAIHSMLMALGIGAGDEVITTPFTFIATATPILMCGARPVFVDIDPDTFNLDPLLVEAAITDKTKAILAVHIFGQITAWDQLEVIAARHKLHLLEDACQAVGARWKGKRAGSLGIAGAFSTYATKNLSTGEGGLVTTDDDEIAEYSRRFRHHGQPAGTRYTYEQLGYNYRMTDIAAAIGRQQLKKIETWNARRRQIAQAYQLAFSRLDNIEVSRCKEAEHVYHLYSLKVKANRDQFQQILNEYGVSNGIYYPLPLYRSKVFASDGDGSYTDDYTHDYAKQFPVCESIVSQILSIPCHPALSDDEVETIINAVEVASRDI